MLHVYTIPSTKQVFELDEVCMFYCTTYIFIALESILLYVGIRNIVSRAYLHLLTFGQCLLLTNGSKCCRGDNPEAPTVMAHTMAYNCAFKCTYGKFVSYIIMNCE